MRSDLHRFPAVVDSKIITTAHYKDMGPWMKGRSILNKIKINDQ